MRSLFTLLIPIAFVFSASCSDDSDPPEKDTIVDRDMQTPDKGPAQDMGADGPAADGPAADTTSDATTQTDLPLDPNGRVILSNVPEVCEPLGLIIPDEGEGGHWAGVRFRPPYHPFSVEAFEYVLEPAQEGSTGDSARCDSTLAHKVFVFKTSEAALPESPTELWSTNVPAGGDASKEQVVELTLDDAIELAEGESIIIAIEMKRTESGPLMCLRACNPVPANSGTDYWSYATEAPFSWGSLSPASIVAKAFGR